MHTHAHNHTHTHTSIRAHQQHNHKQHKHTCTRKHTARTQARTNTQHAHKRAQTRARALKHSHTNICARTHAHVLHFFHVCYSLCLLLDQSKDVRGQCFELNSGQYSSSKRLDDFVADLADYFYYLNDVFQLVRVCVCLCVCVCLFV